MLYTIVERFDADGLELMHDRFRSRGRLLPDGVSYIDSYMDPNGRFCFQLMNAESEAALEEWMRRWSDLVTFEVHEVMRSADFWSKRE